MSRSQVASRVAPNWVPAPRMRAMVPSTMSRALNIAERMAAHTRWLSGINVTTMAMVMQVPATVTVLGLNPNRVRVRAMGSMTTEAGFRPLTLSMSISRGGCAGEGIVGGGELGPGSGEEGAGVPQELW